jgi:hypothetical protein
MVVLKKWHPVPRESLRVAPKNGVHLNENIRGSHTKTGSMFSRFSREAPMKRRPCPRKLSRGYSRQTVPVLEKCQLWHTIFGFPLLEKRRGWYKKTASFFSIRVEGGKQNRSPFSEEESKFSLKKRRPCARERLRLEPKKRQPCPRVKSRVSVK